MLRHAPATCHARDRFRSHSLDGAMLYFHPQSGTHVRFETEKTRELTRQAPRVVMFGITNACNLRCDFCSRDATRESAWTVESAADVVEGFARAGTLEIAFGGGEPFAFRGFEELLTRLHATTELALHVTTNGTLIDAPLLARLHGALGQVRVSIYQNVEWRRTAHILAHADQRWGANVLVSRESLVDLPNLLIELTALGARDVSLLSYVGADPALQLSTQDDATLAAIISASPIACRVSVCFGARLSVPRLFDGASGDGDCGAGLDFLSITPDKRVQSCSFQETSLAIDSAEDALMIWREKRSILRQASPRIGCSRTSLRAPRASQRGIRVWQSFSGNNGGECVLVSKFETREDAEKLLAELIPGFKSDVAYSAPWNELFAREGVEVARSDKEMPGEIVAVGRSLIARTDMAMGDSFPELRALTWKRGGEVIAGGIHVHGDSVPLAIIRARDSSDAKSLEAEARSSGCVTTAHGIDVIVALTRAILSKDDEHTIAPLAPMIAELKALAGDRTYAMEVVFEPVSHDALVAVAKRLGAEAKEKPRVALTFWAPESRTDIADLAKDLDGEVTHVENLVLVENVARKNRLAVHSYRQGASVSSLVGETLQVSCDFWREQPPRTKGKKAEDREPVDAELTKRELTFRLQRDLGEKTFALIECASRTWGGRAFVRVLTAFPADVLKTMASYATANDFKVTLWVNDVDPVEHAVRRLLVDVGVLERAARGK